jgi:glutathione S-transferase
MITLYGGGAAFGLPEMSPYCTKTEVQLRMAGLDFVKQPARPTDSPKGQLPFIDDDGERVADSTFIRAHIEFKYGVDLDEGLDRRQRAEAWALERMIENHLGPTIGYGRFFIPENFARGPAHFVDYAPEEQRPALREDLLARVKATFLAVGTTRHAPDEIEWLGGRSLETLATVLGDKPYVMGERPTAVDGIAFGALAALLTPFFPCPLQRRAIGYRSLVAYTDRMMTRFYPDFAWENAATEATALA